MGRLENDEQRKIRNAHFIRAFEHVKSALNMTQGQLAKAIGSESAYISNFRNGTRPVPPETVEALIHISASQPGLQIYGEYLYGYSDIMLLANVSDEEMVAAQMRRENPDYDVMEKRRKDTESAIEENSRADVLELFAQRVRLVDDLRESLREELAAVRTIRTELQQARDDFRDASTRLSNILSQLAEEPHAIGMAAEEITKPKI